MLGLQFMTRIPIPINIDIQREDFQKIVKFFPIIGLVIGLIEAFIYYILTHISTHMIASFMTIVSHIAITGAMHIDGLGDTADGIFSGRSREKMLEIMKDSRLGTFGALAIIVVVVGKILMLMEIPQNSVITVIILAPVVSRTMNIFLMYHRKYARATEGMGDLFIGVLKKENAIIAVILGCLITIAVGQLQGVKMLIIGFTFTIFFRSYIEAKIGGITGDILGASDELNEFIIYFAMCMNMINISYI
jgi:adenosylcobinamide-GDP ribazoletransferase